MEERVLTHGRPAPAPTANAETSPPTRQGLNRRDLGAVLALLGLSLLLMWPILVGKVPVASNTLALWAPWSQLPHEPITNSAIADSALLYLPWNVFARNAVASGEWPMWDPNSFSGTSFAANSQNQLYYPLTWLSWLLPLPASIQATTLFNLWFAGTGMYFLCRHRRIGRTGSLLAGLGFTGSGLMQLAAELPGVAAAYGWLPWMLLALDRAISMSSIRWAALCALACGLQLVSGNLQWGIYSYFALACWTAWRASAALWSVGLRKATQVLLFGGSALIGGATVALLHLAPVLEMVGLSTRSSALISSHSGPLYSLLRLVMPSFFGTSAGDIGAPLVFNDLWYVGIGLLMLALLALVLPGRPERWLWAGMALFAVLVTYGVGPFLYVRWLPGLNSLLPARIGYLFIFALCLLAALGFESWHKACRECPHRALIGCGAVLIVVAAAVTLSPVVGASPDEGLQTSLQREQIVRAAGFVLIGAVILIAPALQTMTSRGAGLQGKPKIQLVMLAGPLVTLLLIIDLATMAPTYNAFVEPGQVLPKSPATIWLQGRQELGRVLGFGTGSQPPVYVPNVQLLYGLQSVSGYDSLHTARYEALWDSVDPTMPPAAGSTPYSNVFIRPQAYSSTVANLLNTRYIAATEDLTTSLGLLKVYTGEISIYENLQALPRAFLVRTAEVMPPQEELKRLSSPGFDPSKTVLLEQTPPAGRTLSTAGAGAPTDFARVSEYERNSVAIDVSVAEPSWLVLADQNYPGWTATIDQMPTMLYTADYLLRAVEVPAGSHTVQFTFLPTGYWLDLGISLAALVLIIVAVAGGGRPLYKGPIAAPALRGRRRSSQGGITDDQSPDASTDRE